MAPEANRPVIVAKSVTLSFKDKVAVDSVDLTIERGEVFVLMGTSGCGKSTLMKCLIGLLVPDEGTIEIDGVDIVQLGDAELYPVRRKMGVAFQSGALFQSMTVADNVAFPLVETAGLSRDEARWVAHVKLSQVGLADAGDKLPSELSGGMRKRAAIARALALDPAILFLDEPTSGLDPVTSAGIDELVLDINRASGTTVFVVTHDLPSAFAIATRTALMSEGRLLSVLPPEELREDPTPEIASFVNREASRAPPGEGLAKLVEH
jgi:phospholipid/cholesterol/gamma-HCH transport system ATP-binding protein